MAEAVSEGFKVASTVLDAFLKAREVDVVEPLEVIRKIAQERQFSQKFTDQVVSGYLAEPESTDVVRGHQRLYQSGPGALPGGLNRDGAVCREAFGGAGGVVLYLYW
jgi:hypothetical protein